MGLLSKTRHNLGDAFLHLLDDVRQKVVEEPWTGNVQTPAHQLDTQYSDFVAWLYGNGDGEKEPEELPSGRDRGKATGNDFDNWLDGKNSNGAERDQSASLDNEGDDLEL